MTFARIDDGFLDHPKAIEAGEDPASLYLRGLIYCAKHLTDGRIPKGALRILTGKRQADKHAARLVDVRLWEDTGDAWLVHDYHDWNDTAEEIRAARERKAAYLRDLRRRQKGDAEPTQKMTSEPTRTEFVPGSRSAQSPASVRFGAANLRTSSSKHAHVPAVSSGVSAETSSNGYQADRSLRTEVRTDYEPGENSVLSSPLLSPNQNSLPNPSPLPGEGASDPFSDSENRTEPLCSTVEHELNPDPAAFRFAVAKAANTGDLTAATADEDLDLKPLLRSLFAQGFGMADAPIAGAFLAAGGMGQKRAAVCDAGFLTRNRGSNLRWLFQSAREWDRAGRPRLDEKGRAVATPAAAPAPSRAPTAGAEVARIRAETERAAAGREALQARVRASRGDA